AEYDDFWPLSAGDVVGILESGRSQARRALPAGAPPAISTEVSVRVTDAALVADLVVPAGARGLVLFVHGSGSGRKSRRNVAVARTFEKAGFGTMLLDLLTAAEAAEDEVTSH